MCMNTAAWSGNIRVRWGAEVLRIRRNHCLQMLSKLTKLAEEYNVGNLIRLAFHP
jgi:hypothetical protein